MSTHGNPPYGRSPALSLSGSRVRPLRLWISRHWGGWSVMARWSRTLQSGYICLGYILPLSGAALGIVFVAINGAQNEDFLLGNHPCSSRSFLFSFSFSFSCSCSLFLSPSLLHSLSLSFDLNATGSPLPPLSLRLPWSDTHICEQVRVNQQHRAPLCPTSTHAQPLHPTSLPSCDCLFDMSVLSSMRSRNCLLTRIGCRDRTLNPKP